MTEEGFCLFGSHTSTWSFIQPLKFAIPSRLRYSRNAAPAITPQTLPIPPRMTIERMRIEMLKKKSSGKTPVLIVANQAPATQDRKSTRLNSSHVSISYAVFCLKKKNDKTICYV